MHGGRHGRAIKDRSRRGQTLADRRQRENLLRASRDAVDRHRVEKQEVRRSRPLVAIINGLKLAAAKARFKVLRRSGATDAHPFEEVHALVDPTPLEGRVLAYIEKTMDTLLLAASEEDAVIVTLGGDGGLTVRAIESLGLLTSEATA